jgi:hypothetical protein
MQLLLQLLRGHFKSGLGFLLRVLLILTRRCMSEMSAHNSVVLLVVLRHRALIVPHGLFLPLLLSINE